jgi:hypothetical protein
MTYFDPGNGKFVAVDGCLVDRDCLHIAEKIQDYDPDLQLIALDPDDLHASITSAPFMVIRHKGDGTYERVLEAWELDDRVIERLWLADGTRNNQLDQLVSLEQAKKAKEDYDNSQKMWQNHELFAAAMSNKKSEFSYKNEAGEHVTIKDTEGVVKNKGRQSFS